jgi:hypothetical protein
MAGTWKTFQAPDTPSGAFNADTMILLTDGSVLIHNGNDTNAITPCREWLRLTPDAQGNYATGTWSAVITMTNAREFFSSGVLKDGRVYVIGGEYSDDLADDTFNNPPTGQDCPLGEIFDPLTNSWSQLNKPSAFNWIRGDTTGCILADGRVLLGALQSSRTAVWDPTHGSWTETGLKFGAVTSPTKVSDCDEETWTLLTDGSVLTVEVAHPPAAEKYVPSLDAWVSAGQTPQRLVLTSLNQTAVDEIGPIVLLPNGTAFAIGATGHTAIYTPPSTGANQPGSWSVGPDFPADTSGNKLWPILTAIDAPACLLPSGKVLCVAGATYGEGQPATYWSGPTTFFEYDPATNSFTRLANQPATNSNDTWTARLLLLPTGEVLYSSQQNQIALHTPDPADGQPEPAWRPVITRLPQKMVPGQTYTISGTQLNGLSQAVSYGDDAQMATNYPLVQLKNSSSGAVVYLRTFNFSSMGVATGNTPQSASIQIPTGIQTGQWNMVVIANGIASDPVAVAVTDQALFIHDKTDYERTRKWKHE